MAAVPPEAVKRPLVVGVPNKHYDLEITQAIAREMGLAIQLKCFPYESLVQALKSGEVDVLAHAAYTEARARIFDFSPPYSTGSLTLFGRKDSPPLTSLQDWYTKDVMVWKNHSISEIAAEEGWKAITLVESEEKMLRLLDAGVHDYAAVNTKIGNSYIAKLGLNNVMVVSPEPIVSKFCFAVKKENCRWLEPFIAGLAVLHKTGEDKRLRIKWTGEEAEQPGVAWDQVVKYGGIIVGVVLLALGTIGLWSWMLRKQVAQRTAELSAEIKERRRAEEELRRNQEKLVQTEKLAAIGTLVSGVAHEINNPNGLILLNLALLKEVYEGARGIAEEWYAAEGDFAVGKWHYSEVREKLGTILDGSLQASRQVAQIVQDLKDYSRQENAELNEDVDLNLVAGDAVRLIANVIRQSTDSFVARYAGDLPLIRGNARRIEQVVVNLLLNACQALPERGKGIELTTFYEREQRTVGLKIADEGVGIAPEALLQITDPFYTTKREQGGTGLGLSVSSAIVKEHRGLLVFDSVVGRCTVVTISFPLAAEGIRS